MHIGVVSECDLRTDLSPSSFSTLMPCCAGAGWMDRDGLQPPAGNRSTWSEPTIDREHAAGRHQEDEARIIILHFAGLTAGCRPARVDALAVALCAQLAHTRFYPDTRSGRACCFDGADAIQLIAAC